MIDFIYITTRVLLITYMMGVGSCQLCFDCILGTLATRLCVVLSFAIPNILSWFSSLGPSRNGPICVDIDLVPIKRTLIVCISDNFYIKVG